MASISRSNAHVGAAVACALSVMLACADSDFASKPEPALDELIAASFGDAKTEAYRAFITQELPKFQTALQPSLAAMPRNAHGKLLPTTVRYALFRFFEKTRGWHIVGLDPEGQSWNGTSPLEAKILKRMPANVRALIEVRLQVEGLNVHEVAVLAATMEHLIHDEAVEGLKEVYSLLGISLNETVSEEKALRAVDLYEASYLIGFDFGKNDPKVLMKNYPQMDKLYPPWPRMQKFSHELTSSVRQGALRGAGFSFAEVARAITLIGDGYGHWATSECTDLKNHLIKMEDHGTGRVRLADFHGTALHDDKWQFQESTSYLRQLGALDETNPGNVRVIIPNYINGLSNCVGNKDSHMVCCISECEGIFGQIESSLGVPEATPEDIAALVVTLSSASVPAGRSLSTLELHRLHSIAETHDGLVPIHGRLFAQWLHHVYPKECPYPHASGTTKPQNMEDWLVKSGRDPMASQEELKSHAGQIQKQRQEGPVEHARWTSSEELYVAAPATEVARPPGFVAVYMAAATLLLALGRMVRGGARQLQGLKMRKPGASPARATFMMI